MHVATQAAPGLPLRLALAEAVTEGRGEGKWGSGQWGIGQVEGKLILRAAGAKITHRARAGCGEGQAGVERDSCAVGTHPFCGEGKKAAVS